MLIIAIKQRSTYLELVKNYSRLVLLSMKKLFQFSSNCRKNFRCNYNFFKFEISMEYNSLTITII